MTLSRKRDHFTNQNLISAASHADLKPARAKATLSQVHAAISRWPAFAESAGVSPEWFTQIHQNLRLNLKP
jgi:hypothetical protein